MASLLGNIGPDIDDPLGTGPKLDFGLPNARRRRRSQSSGEDMSEAEKQSLLSSIGSGVMSGLEAVGNLLDVPGSMVRDVLAGQNPLDQLLSPLSHENRTTGRGLLEKHGLLSKNTEGLDWGDVGGFGAEVLLDPLILLVGPGKAIAGGAKAASNASKGLTATARIAEIAKGERGLLGLKVPFASEPFAVLGKGEKAAKVAEAAYFNPVSRGLRQAFSTNPLLRNADSPLGLGAFNKATQMTADSEWTQLLKNQDDLVNTITPLAAKARELDEANRPVVMKFFADNPQAAEVLAGEVGNVADMTVSDMLRALGEIRPTDPGKLIANLGESKLAGVLAEIDPAAARNLVVDTYQRKLFPVVSKAKQPPKPWLKALDENPAKIVTEVSGLPDEQLVKMLGSLPDNIHAQLLALLPDEQVARAVNGMVSGDAARLLSGLPDERFASVMGGIKQSRVAAQVQDDAARMAGMLSNPDAATLGEMVGRYAPGDTVLPEVAKQYDDLVKQLVDIKDSARQQVLNMGGSVAELDDLLTAHMPRKPSPLVLRLLGKGKGASTRRDTFWGQVMRDDAYRDVPGGTWTINRMSKDMRLAAKPIADETDLLQRMAILQDEYGIPGFSRVDDGVQSHIPLKQTGNFGQKPFRSGKPWFEPDPLNVEGRPMPSMQTEKLARKLAELPKEVLDQGLFGRDVLADVMDYALAATRLRAALGATHGLLATVASHADDALGVPIEEAFRSVFSGRGAAVPFKGTWGQAGEMDKALANFVQEYGKQAAGQGFDAATDISKVRVPEEFVSQAQKFLKYHANPREAEGILKLYDKFTSFWKSMIYMPFPSSRTRDFVSDMWKNTITAFDSPAHGMRSIKQAFDLARGMDPGLIQEMKLAGVFDGGMLDEIQSIAHGFNGVPTAQDFIQPIKDVFSSKVLSRGVDNPLNLFNISSMREGLEEGSKFLPVDIGEKSHRLQEFITKASHYLARREKGWSPSAAARSVKTHLFDYGQLSEFEKRIMKRLMPFYTYARKNLPHMLNQLIDAPGGAVAQTIRAANVTRHEYEDRFIPRWLSQGLVIPRGKDPASGASQYLVSSSMFPFEEAFNRVAIRDGKLDFRRTLENVAGMANPLLQYPAQAVAERQFWSHRPKNRLYSWPTDNALASDVLAQSPVSRLLTTTRQLTDSRKSIGEKLTNFFVGGVKATDIDEAALIREALDVLKENLEVQPGVGEYSRPYAAQQERLSPEAMQQLSLYGYLLKDLKRAREAKPKPAR